MVGMRAVDFLILCAALVPAAGAAQAVSAAKARPVTASDAGAWVANALGGDFAYLRDHASVRTTVIGSGIGTFGAARSSETQGTAAEVGIPFGSFVYNDKPTSRSGVWTFYGTAVRAPDVLGPTHILEGDVTNLGSIVSLTPSRPQKDGQTDVAWLACGGEYAFTHTNLNTCSVAMEILSNDPNRHARFETGIVFEQNGLAFHKDAMNPRSQATATALALGFGHYLRWFSKDDDVIAQVGATETKGVGGGFEISVRDPNGGIATLSVGGLAANALVPSTRIALGTSAFPWSKTTTGALNIAASTAPAHSTDPCTKGDISWNTDFVYVCVAANEWRRTALSSF